MKKTQINPQANKWKSKKISWLDTHIHKIFADEKYDFRCIEIKKLKKKKKKKLQETIDTEQECSETQKRFGK